MKKLSFLLIILSCLFVSCDSENEPTIVDLNNKTFDLFMAEQDVITQIPATLTTGDNAPFYLVDPNRQIYMKVIADNGDRLSEGQECYFRYTTYTLEQSENGIIPIKSTTTEDNPISTPADNLEYIYNSVAPTVLPLRYVGDWSEVYLAIRQISDKADPPILMHLRYFPKDH